MSKTRGFTLIELLIVVAIIAILAAIAVPNFLEAQTRAKVSRAKADLRSIVTALESYRIDHNVYPPHRGRFVEQENVHILDGNGNARVNGFRTIPLRLSTPISYITSTALIDPFKGSAEDISGFKYDSGDPTDLAFGYHNIFQYVFTDMAGGFFEDDFTQDYGFWRIFSLGPNGTYDGFGAPDFGWIYDPTNGTISRGGIIRSQLAPDVFTIPSPDP